MVRWGRIVFGGRIGMGKYLEDILSQSDLLALVKESNPKQLKRLSSKEWTCCSPLRSDRKPSFSIYINENKWRDYGTGEHGSVIDYIEKRENLNTREAMDFLAERFGVRKDESVSDYRPIYP